LVKQVAANFFTHDVRREYGVLCKRYRVQLRVASIAKFRVSNENLGTRRLPITEPIKRHQRPYFNPISTSVPRLS
jgi:hypothetical protein